MDLSALWSHERARLRGAHPELPSSAAHSNSSSAFDRPIVEETKSERQVRGLGRVSSPAGALWPQQQQPPQHTPKRRSTVFAKRDAVFKRLVDESVLPTVSTVATVQNFFDCNEFAMEYADRAPKRFHAMLSSAGGASAAETSGAGQGSGGVASSSNGGALVATAGSPQRKEKKATPRSIGRLQPPVPISNSNINNSSRASETLGTPHAATGGLSSVVVSELPTSTSLGTSKASFLSRKNGRKRLEFSTARGAFRPYIGDMFGTRGEYIDGMLYMSRMKRSHQLTFGSDVSPVAKGSRTLFGSTGPFQLVSALKDAVSSALASGGAAGDSDSGVVGAATAAGVDRTPAPGDFAGSTVSSMPAASFSGGHGTELSVSDHPMKQRRRCALTLSNWSSNPENAVLMVREGVVEALIVLCRAHDSVTRLHCVTALMNLSHVVELRRVIVRQGAVKTIAEIVDESEDRTLRTACAITLCNLCCLEGDEEALVEDGAVSALSVLIAEQPKVAWLCRSALFNLTCVREPYQKIENVVKMFITLTSSSGGGGSSAASSSSTSSSFTAADCDEVTAKALCNLSNFKRIRLRLMEEGVLGTIASLIHVNAPAIQEMLAYVLLNLSALKACRSEMVAKGCMGTLVVLTGATSVAAAKLLIASTLFNLSKEPGNRLRMVFEGLLLLVNELSRSSVGYPGGEALRTVCARTLYNMSCSDDTRVKLVERDGVSVLSSLSRRTSDRDAKRMCTLALCNLLGVQQAAADIMNAGAITALIQLSMTPDQPLETKRLFSKALHGLCEQRETRDAVTRAGVIPAILYLSSIGDEDDGETERERDGPGAGTARPETGLLTMSSVRSAGLVSEIRARCTAALACLAADDALAVHVRNAQVVRCVTRILVLERTHVGIERFCGACLSLLCRDEECAQLMADDGAVQVVLATCVETQDIETKASCCNVLASMSCHPGCCAALARMGVVSVLATLAKIKEDKGVQRCCAVTLANLSAEPSIRSVLVAAGIVGTIVRLSNTYSEESQRDCAKVLCNLSCVPGTEAMLVRDGAISVLMMIGMVRAVNASTKATCARALFNLLNAETIKAMVQDGLVKVLPAFVALATDAAATTSSTSCCEVVAMLFLKLVEHPVGRNALCIERSAIQALFALMDRASGSSAPVQRLFESLLCELVYYENSRLPSVTAGIIDALHKTTMRGRSVVVGPDAAVMSCPAKRLALVLFTLSKSDATRVAVASSASLATLTEFLKRHVPTPACANAECVLYAVSTLCVLAWHSDTCGRLENSEISSVLVRLLTPAESAMTTQTLSSSGTNDYSARVIKTALLTLCCISQSQELLQAMLRGGIVDALYAILGRDLPLFGLVNAELARDSDFLALTSTLCRQLSHTPQLSAMAGTRGSHVIPLLCTLVALVAENDPESSLDCADALCSVTFATVKMSPSSSSSLTSIGGSSDPVASLASSNVVGAINTLLSDAQLPETRWRCAASLWAMSFLPAYRSRLVALGCTRILVRESYRSDASASLSILQCCAGALCNFTLVTGDTSAVSANAATMVAEDAVPALLQLSKLENAEVREHCTLALTNLSGQSPKVEAGAVSALLSLSLHVGSTHHRLGSAATPQISALCQPPIVCGERHKQFSTLPEFAMQIERDERVSERKYEADLAASTPPPPHLPTIPVELDDSSSNGGSGNAKHQQGGGGNAIDDDEMRPQSTDTADHASSRDECCLHGPRVALEAKSFPKVDPSESRLLGGSADADDGSDDSGDPVAVDGVSGSARNGAADDLEEAQRARRNGGEGGVGGSDPDDAAEQGETVGQLRKGATLLKGGSGYSLSPLARVVVRKTQAAQIAKKLKDLRVRRSEGGGGFASSSPSLVSLSSSSSNVALGAVSLANRSSSRGLIQTTTEKSGQGVDETQPCKLVGDAFSASRSRVESQANDATPLSRPDGMSAIAAAAAAARLYGLPASSSASVAPDGRSKKRAEKPSLKKKKKRMVVVIKPTAATELQSLTDCAGAGAGAASAVRPKPAAAAASRAVLARYLPTPVSSSEDEDDESDRDFCMLATEQGTTSAAIAEFREQAKKFGLWS